MAPLAALLWRSLRVHQVYGANTDVGKTIFTTILCNAARKGWKDENISYLKPVSTGASEDADDRCKFFFVTGLICIANEFGLQTCPHTLAMELLPLSV